MTKLKSNTVYISTENTKGMSDNWNWNWIYKNGIYYISKYKYNNGIVQ